MLERLIKNKNSAKVIEHFVLHERWEQNQKDLCEELNIYPKAMSKILRNLLNLKLIKISRRVAKSKFYTINNDSDLIDPLRLLIRKLTYKLITNMMDKK